MRLDRLALAIKSLIHLIQMILMGLLNRGMNFGVAESNYECQFCTHPRVSLNLGFKNSTKEDSYLKSATPEFSVTITFHCTLNPPILGDFPLNAPPKVGCRVHTSYRIPPRPPLKEGKQAN